MSWYSSWLPAMPSINFPIPSSIQGRFISFVLKKLLGHLLKPGQLDAPQIDSQIGSGYVQINDLELNTDAINSYLVDLPLSLHSGRIQSVTASIPWPNPLKSVVGFSLKSLHLTFHVLSSLKRTSFHDFDIAESVASVAESFVYEELTPREETRHRESFHPDVSLHEGQAVPGSLDPFLVNEDEETHHPDVDPAGISMFASFIERLMARFEFNAEDIRITFIDQDNITLTLSSTEIRCFTNVKGSRDQKEGDISAEGEIRTLSLTGLTVSGSQRSGDSESVHDLIRTPTPNASSHEKGFSQSIPRTGTNAEQPSPSSSNSSLDEVTEYQMSQSLAFLPPRAVSPVESMSGSLYHSAVSDTSTFRTPSESQVDPRWESLESSAPNVSPPSELRREPLDRQEAIAVEEVMLSLGSAPVVIQLTTPPPNQMAKEAYPDLSSPSKQAAVGDQLHVSVNFGVIAGALQPWQIRGTLKMVDKVISAAVKPRHTPSRSISSTPSLSLNISLSVRALTLLLLPSANQQLTGLEAYFDHPLVPPRLSYDYVRIYLESISGSVSIVQDTAHSIATALTPQFSTSINIRDISIFSFSAQVTRDLSTVKSRPSIVTPILVTDPFLPLQYHQSHIHPRKGHDATKSSLSQPSFSILDWTNPRCSGYGAKISHWRCRPPLSDHTPQPDGIDSSAPSQPHPALSLTFKYVAQHEQGSSLSGSQEVHIKVSPFHVCVDLEKALQSGGIIHFIEEVFAQKEDNVVHDPDDDGMGGDSPVGVNSPLHTSQTLHNQLENETTLSQKRHKNVVLEDLDSSQEHGVRNLRQSEFPDYGIKPYQAKSASFVINIPMIRLSISAPPPMGRAQRSGIFVIDLQGIEMANGDLSTGRKTRFETLKSVYDEAQKPSVNQAAPLLEVRCRRLVVACSSLDEGLTTSILSVGPLNYDSEVVSRHAPLLLYPRIKITRSIPPDSEEQSTKLAICAEVPSVFIQVSKFQYDTLQYWIDDVAQFLEARGKQENDKLECKSGNSKEISMIGSRFFVKSRTNSASDSSRTPAVSPAVLISLNVTETSLRINLPRKDNVDIVSRPFDISGSDLSVSVEFNSRGKQQTVLTLNFMEAWVHNTAASGDSETFVSSTSLRGLSSSLGPLVQLRLVSSIIPDTIAKETRLSLTLCGVTCNVYPDVRWLSDLTVFSKSPPGTFEAVIPSERTCISVKLIQTSLRAFAPNHPGAIVLSIEDLDFATDVIGESPDSLFRVIVPSMALLAAEDVNSIVHHEGNIGSSSAHSFWKASGYALLADISALRLLFKQTDTSDPKKECLIDEINLRIHACADSLSAVSSFVSDITKAFEPFDDHDPRQNVDGNPTLLTHVEAYGSTMLASIEDLAFKRMPEIGPAPDMIHDDLPTNLDYLDESFGAAGGFRELRDDDLDDFDIEDTEAGVISSTSESNPSVISKIGGETIRMLLPESINIVEDYFDNLPPEVIQETPSSLGEIFRLRVRNGDIRLLLYDGYDWSTTRKTIEEEVKEMRKRLAKIRQLVASGQTQDPDVGADETSALLFNSVYIGLEQDIDAAEPNALIAAIDEELKDDMETGTESSWQSLRPQTSGLAKNRSLRMHGKRLTRSRGSSIEFCLSGVDVEFNQYGEDSSFVSRTFATVKDLEILDHIKTSTWKKFLTALRSDSHGNVRETGADMVRVELLNVRPVPGHSYEEARLRAKILPLRLYVDQDAVDFLKKFFSFKDPRSSDDPQLPSTQQDAYIQMAEIFPIDLKLDYKPRRVDYRALREGRTIELMNFFHFDGAEMTLRHITLAGVTGWSRLFEMLNDLWTPDVKATQLVDVISGVAPIRSMVNVGSGVADLVLLPISQYKKDGRIVRGVQKGTTAFVKSTAVEAIKMGARLAIGTQVILEQAEGILGGEFDHTITAETLQYPLGEEYAGRRDTSDDEEAADQISKYAQQPMDIREGVQSAYRSLQRNLNSAAQTILAVPMEVYERSGNEGPVRSVIRAVPIAVLKPMIGATEAVSKTLLGLHNTLDPNVRHDNEAKYKNRS